MLRGNLLFYSEKPADKEPLGKQPKGLLAWGWLEIYNRFRTEYEPFWNSYKTAFFNRLRIVMERYLNPKSEMIEIVLKRIKFAFVYSRYRTNV